MKSLYVMKSGEAYKIGVSKDPEKRMKELQTGNPDIKLVYKSELLGNAYEVESKLHNMYLNNLITGEWFSFESEDSLISDVKELVKEIGDLRKNGMILSGNKDQKIKALVSLALEPKKRELEQIIKEIEEIEDGNKMLASILVNIGWTEDEVNELIEKAVSSVQ